MEGIGKIIGIIAIAAVGAVGAIVSPDFALLTVIVSVLFISIVSAG